LPLAIELFYITIEFDPNQTIRVCKGKRMRGAFEQRQMQALEEHYNRGKIVIINKQLVLQGHNKDDKHETTYL